MTQIKKVVVLVSGEGTNLQALIDIKNLGLLPIEIVAVVSNNQDCKALVRAQLQKIPTHSIIYKNTQTRENYDEALAEHISLYQPDLVLLLGYMRIVTSVFIRKFRHILNIHPALPGEFPGSNAIGAAFNKKDEITETGVMVHRVIEEVDAGEVVDFIRVPIFSNDTYEELRTRVRQAEKPLLIGSIMKYTSQMDFDKNESPIVCESGVDSRIISGKVRDRFDLGYNLMCFYHSDRLSSFDRHICYIKGKGELLNMINDWWMRNTTHIMPNHHLYSQGKYLVSHKCEVIPLEIIVRAYITGSTKTSLWTHYNKGVRNYCGVAFPDGLQKNQKLDKPVITPTTKGETDELISYEDIIRSGIVSSEDLDYIYDKAMELFEFGSQVVSEKGLILVDTKYEFGRAPNGEIMLIDEIHTCDSSRFWQKSSYDHLFNSQREPEKLDKDAARDYVKSICDPYQDEIPEIPEEKKASVLKCYQRLYELLTGDMYYQVLNTTHDDNIDLDPLTNNALINYFDNIHSHLVVILSGSESDEWHINKLRENFAKHNIYAKEHICSAHKKTKQLLGILEEYNSYAKFNRKIIYITVAGRSNALSGVVACNTHYPVIACPPFQDKMDMQVNINSTIQMPSKVPVMTILDPGNVVLCCQRIFGLV